MQLIYDADEPSERKWTASTDSGDYDACGATPIDAVSGLCAVLEDITNDK